MDNSDIDEIDHASIARQPGEHESQPGSIVSQPENGAIVNAGPHS